MNYYPHQITRLKSTYTKQPLPIILISLDKTQENSEIYNLKSICYIKIRVEAFKKSKGPSQCHRCQAYGHSQTYCKENPKCVKCCEAHLTKDCNKNKTTPAKCCNCQGNHPANFKGCPHYTKITGKSNTQKEQKTTSQTQIIPTQVLANKNRIPYAQAAAITKNTQRPSANNPIPPPPLQPENELLGIILQLMNIAINNPSKIQALKTALTKL
jgi:hypothetical protein